MKKIVGIILVLSVLVFTLLSILAIWDILDEDVAWQSLATLGVILVASLITLTAIKILENKK